MCLLPHVDNTGYRCGQSATVDGLPLREMSVSRKALPPWHFAVHSGKGDRQMNEQDEALIKEAEEVGLQLYREVVDELSSEGHQKLCLWESVSLARMFLTGVLRPGPAYDPVEMRQDLRETLDRATMKQ